MLFDLSSAVALQHTLGDARAISELAMAYADGELLKKISRRDRYFYLLSDQSTICKIRLKPLRFWHGTSVDANG